jgi:hypothetical protein
MKRQCMSVLAMSSLLAAMPASAGECKQVRADAPLDCRQIAESSLGGHFCLVPEGIGIRAVGAGGGDPWVTSEPIDLGGVVTGSHGAPCRRSIVLPGNRLSIARVGGGYELRTVGEHKVTLQMTATTQQGHDLWLAGVDPNQPDIHYFAFLRDRPQSGKLAKFIVIEALDFRDGRCRDNAPVIGTTVTGGACPAMAKADAKAALPGDATVDKETGVGGGGEGHKNP